MTRATRCGVGAGLLVGGLWLAGCASLGTGSPDPAAPAAAAAVDPDAPAEFHFLVGRELELEGRLREAQAAYRRASAKDPDDAFLHRKLAQLAIRHGDLEEALSEGQRAMELEPEDDDTRLLLGTIHRVRRDAAAAESTLLGPDGQPRSADAGFLLYTIYAEVERLDAAEATAQWLVADDPDSLRGWFALANAYQRQDRPADAEEALRSALERQPGSLAVYNALARSRHMQGDRAGEIEVYREVLAHHPNHHATLSSLADALLAERRVDEAIGVLETLETNHPSDVRSSVRLALLEYDQGRYQEAASRLERALAERPAEHGVAYFLGLVRQRLGKNEAALEAFGRIPEGHGRYVDARTQMAAIFEDRGEYERAIEAVEQARQAKPTRALDLYAASLQAKVGEFDDAVALLERLLEDAPEDDELLYNLGVLHGEAQRHDRALYYMERALERNPDNPSVLNYIGYTWAERGENLDEAEAMITRALELRPEDGYIADSLAWVWYMRARPLVASGRPALVAEGRSLLRRARAQLYRADELAGGDPVIAEHLGDVYLLLEDKNRAYHHYGRALQLDPREAEQPELRDKFERLRLEIGAP